MFFENFSHLAPVISGVSTLIVGFVIFIQDKKMLHARVFATFSFVLAAWSLGSAYMFMQCRNEEYAIFIDRLIYLFVSAIPAIIFHFSSIYSPKEVRKTEWILLGYVLMVLFWGLTWSPFFVDGLYQFGNGCHSRAGVLHHLFLIYFIGFAVGAVYNVLRLYRITQLGEKKRQYQFVFYALTTQTIVGSTAFLPAYGFNTLALSYFSGLITTFILVYAMFRHNLLELKVVAINIFISFVVVTSLFQIFLVQSHTLKIINVIIFVLMVILGVLVAQNVREEIQTRIKGEQLARYLANANARLRELDKQKTEFVSIASHQLRSPIAAIKGYSSLVLEDSYGKVPKHLKEPLSRILESGQRIGIMVDDFLNVTRIEQGRMTYSKAPHSVCDLVQQVVNELQVVAKEKGLELSFSPSHDESLKVFADEGKIKQIFSNIIDNALKYTKEGYVRVFVEYLDKEGKVLIRVKDSGIGIAPEEIQNLFQKFNRASNANEVNVLGTGLGLYIAREILKAHEGWVGVESEGIGKGSVFTIELPVYLETEGKKT